MLIGHLSIMNTGSWNLTPKVKHVRYNFPHSLQAQKIPLISTSFFIIFFFSQIMFHSFILF